MAIPQPVSIGTRLMRTGVSALALLGVELVSQPASAGNVQASSNTTVVHQSAATFGASVIGGSRGTVFGVAGSSGSAGSQGVIGVPGTGSATVINPSNGSFHGAPLVNGGAGIAANVARGQSVLLADGHVLVPNKDGVLAPSSAIWGAKLGQPAGSGETWRNGVSYDIHWKEGVAAVVGSDGFKGTLVIAKGGEAEASGGNVSVHVLATQAAGQVTTIATGEQSQRAVNALDAVGGWFGYNLGSGEVIKSIAFPAPGVAPDVAAAVEAPKAPTAHYAAAKKGGSKAVAHHGHIVAAGCDCCAEIAKLYSVVELVLLTNGYLVHTIGGPDADDAISKAGKNILASLDGMKSGLDGKSPSDQERLFNSQMKASFEEALNQYNALGASFVTKATKAAADNPAAAPEIMAALRDMAAKSDVVTNALVALTATVGGQSAAIDNQNTAIGKMNLAIVDAGTKITDLQGQIVNSATAITTLKSAIGEETTQIGNLTSLIDKQAKEIGQLNKQVDQMAEDSNNVHFPILAGGLAVLIAGVGYVGWSVNRLRRDLSRGGFGPPGGGVPPGRGPEGFGPPRPPRAPIAARVGQFFSTKWRNFAEGRATDEGRVNEISPVRQVPGNLKTFFVSGAKSTGSFFAGARSAVVAKASTLRAKMGGSFERIKDSIAEMRGVKNTLGMALVSGGVLTNVVPSETRTQPASETPRPANDATDPRAVDPRIVTAMQGLPVAVNPGVTSLHVPPAAPAQAGLAVDAEMPAVKAEVTTQKPNYQSVVMAALDARLADGVLSGATKHGQLRVKQTKNGEVRFRDNFRSSVDSDVLLSRAANGGFNVQTLVYGAKDAEGNLTARLSASAFVTKDGVARFAKGTSAKDKQTFTMVLEQLGRRLETTELQPAESRPRRSPKAKARNLTLAA